MIEFYYNTKGMGPKVVGRGNKPLLIYLFNKINGKKTEVCYIPLPADHFYIFNRQWFTDWRVEVYEWVNGNLKTVAIDEFSPTYKPTHFYLESDNLEDSIEYSKACLDYVNHWEINDFLIETQFFQEINQILEIENCTESITSPEGCYVNYIIKKGPSCSWMEECWGVNGLVNEEVVFSDPMYPYTPKNISAYDLAHSILFGPNYKTIERIIPYDWVLKERIVSSPQT